MPTILDKSSLRPSARRLRVEPLEQRALLDAAGWPGHVIHDGGGNLYTLDIDNGFALEYVGTMDYVMFDMAFSPSGVLYAVDNPPYDSSGLFEIEVDFESPTPIVETHFLGTIALAKDEGIYVNSLEFRQDGELFAAGYDEYGNSCLFSITPGTAPGAKRELYLDDFGYVYESAGDLAFDSDGNLYLTTSDWGDLLRIDPSLDSFEAVGDTGYADIFGLISGPGPVVYGFREGGGVYRVNTDTGATTEIPGANLGSVYGAATRFKPPTDLGEVDFLPLSNQQPILGELWYRVVATRDAILSVDLAGVDPAEEIETSLYVLNAEGSLTLLETGDTRLDYESATAGQEYFVQIEGAESNPDVRIVNLVQLQSNGAFVHGTDDDDTFEFAAGLPYVFSINEVQYQYNFSLSTTVVVTFEGNAGHNSAQVAGINGDDEAVLNLGTFSGTIKRRGRYRLELTDTREISFDGKQGDDSATLIGSGAGNTIGLQPNSAYVNGIGSRLDVTDVESIEIDGALGSDSAILQGGSGQETLELWPGYGEWTSDSFSHTLSGVETITANAAGQDDTARLHDSDKLDTFVADPDSATLSGDGYTHTVNGFRNVTAYGSNDDGFIDTATISDRAGSKQIFVGTPNYGELIGSDFLVREKNFDVVNANASDSDDEAKLFDSSGPDAFIAGPDSATLSGIGFVVNVNQFRKVHAFASADDGSIDTATLSDKSGSNDTFIGRPTLGRLYGGDFSNRAVDFDVVYANATGSDEDTANLYDSAGLDVLTAGPDSATFSGDGFSHNLSDFRYLNAYASDDDGSIDTATLNGLSGSNDTFYARPAVSRLIGSGYRNMAQGFDVVNANGDASDGDKDTAHLYDSAGPDVFSAQPRSVTLSGIGFAYNVEGFHHVYAYASNDDGSTDTAAMSGVSGTKDFFVAGPDNGRFYGPGYHNRALNFDVVNGDGDASEGDNDFARLDDSTGPDALVAGPGSATLSGNGFSSTATDFRYVQAYASDDGSTDTATLNDLPGSQDTLVAGPATSVLYGATFTNRIYGFDQVTANATGGEKNVATLYDSTGSDTFEGRPGYAKMTFHNNANYFVLANDFSHVHAYATATDPGSTDVAYLYGSTGNDEFKGDPNTSRLYGTGFYNRALYFDVVYADGVSGPNDMAILYDSAAADSLFARNDFNPDLVRLSFGGTAKKIEVKLFDDVTAHGNKGGGNTEDRQDPLNFTLDDTTWL